MMTTRVGFIGLGNIGKPMAINIAKAGFDLMVYDLRAEPIRELTALGAKAARSADEIGAHGEIIELVVVDDAQVEAALLGEGGVFSGAKRGSIIAIHSTVHPRTVRRLAEQAAAKGLTLIDAEVSGGERGAIAKSLCYMVGGDKAALEKCRPIFATSGASIFHLGDLGSGAITKLAHNLIVYVNILAASEGMRLAARDRDLVHCPPQEFLSIFRTSPSLWLGENIRHNPTVTVRFGECRMKAIARVLDYRTDRQLWDEAQAIADRKYGWGDGLLVEVTRLPI
jgi:3-hydroxyisobutyrate dehydrogenase